MFKITVSNVTFQLYEYVKQEPELELPDPASAVETKAPGGKGSERSTGLTPNNACVSLCVCVCVRARLLDSISETMVTHPEAASSPFRPLSV